MPDTWLALYANNGASRAWSPISPSGRYTSGLTARPGDGPLGEEHRLHAALRLLSQGHVLQQETAVGSGVAEPPKTLDEFRAAAEKVSKLPGKSGYCLRGGPGGLNGWVMFSAAMAGSKPSSRRMAPRPLPTKDGLKGVSYLTDLYKSGLAPKDSINWGFNEIVGGFYSAPAPS
jgi:carbohydrate ABC transporter substrate-binding protein, CUT1 family (TC 3.A.1.1.-)